ncbi:MAG TPA: PTS sugar transporter subunit IIA [Rectinemataceae bacterium]
MALMALLDESAVKVPLLAKDKAGIIRELVDLLSASGKVNDSEALLRAVLERESLGSTGLENGIAVPHGKTDAVKDVCLAVGVAPEGVDFDSADGKPSRLFFLLAAPKGKAGPHIAALSEIARLAHSASLIGALVRAKDSAELLDLLR